MQWMDVILTAVQWVVSVWCQRTTRVQRRGGWTWGAWSASVTSISTTGQTTNHVCIITNFLHFMYMCMSVSESVLGVIWLKRYFIYCKKYLFSGLLFNVYNQGAKYDQTQSNRNNWLLKWYLLLTKCKL